MSRLAYAPPMGGVFVSLAIAAGVVYLIASSRPKSSGSAVVSPTPLPPGMAPSAPTMPPGGVPLPGGGGVPPIVLPTSPTPCLLAANPQLAEQFRQIMAGFPSPPEVVDAAAALATQAGCLDEAAALRAEANRRRVPARTTAPFRWVPTT